MPQEKKDCVYCRIVAGQAPAHVVAEDEFSITHIFLVPSHQGDVLDGFFNALEKFQVLPGELAALKDDDRMAETAAKIRRAGGI